MKSKLLNYLLIAAVAMVWGLIIYRVVDAVSGEDEPIVLQNKARPKEPLQDYAMHPDTTSLALNYPDPFEHTAPRETKSALAVPVEVKPLPVSTAPHLTPPTAVNWSFISYGGYLRNPGSKKTLALVTINGREFMLSEGETAEQVKLLKNMRDSIKIAFAGKTRYIAINKRP
ncbi:hypothetical protein MUY27_20120 [Mucilaginibacter sp. RS28]|uniref:Uncharacterized protein n=1 Tax=Mucilaginibacter straminoryzae TaxID=2932774 RepID=A0A9X1X6Q1_9SPHI|nr:hypothetical protein [Mucilaginibacter straminoryzae]MCJ8212034.1 hypothetical protein [Mucilaginibacter straminoryzae]